MQNTEIVLKRLKSISPLRFYKVGCKTLTPHSFMLRKERLSSIIEVFSFEGKQNTLILSNKNLQTNQKTLAPPSFMLRKEVLLRIIVVFSFKGKQNIFDYIK